MQLPLDIIDINAFGDIAVTRKFELLMRLVPNPHRLANIVLSGSPSSHDNHSPDNDGDIGMPSAIASKPSSTVTHASTPTLIPEDAVSDAHPTENVGTAGSTGLTAIQAEMLSDKMRAELEDLEDSDLDSLDSYSDVTDSAHDFNTEMDMH